jgi:hypothetical protein
MVFCLVYYVGFDRLRILDYGVFVMDRLDAVLLFI